MKALLSIIGAALCYMGTELVPCDSGRWACLAGTFALVVMAGFWHQESKR